MIMMLLITGEFKRAGTTVGHRLQDYMINSCIEYCRDSYYLCILAQPYLNLFTRAAIIIFLYA